jgi:tRNA-2-methylthio-N6-dimethylallyladenosine synthase
MNKTFHIVTFGCQMNKLDSELLQAAMESRGLRPVARPEEADVVIYNTCSVRQHAEDRVWSHLGEWRGRARRDPRFILGVIGCMAQRVGEGIAQRFDYVRLICGTRAFLRVPDYIARIAETGERVVALDEGPVTFERNPDVRSEPHRAYVSIMRGCDNYCAYCIVPYVRGREESRPPDEVVEEVRRLCDRGVVEVTLLGQNVNSYGKRSPAGVTLAGLLARVNEVPGLRRLRFLTSHPKDMSEDILRAVADLDKACEHMHMPAQSGSDAVLERMNRRYTRAHYAGLIERGRELIPGVEFSSDFLVGFPGETDADFEQTLSLQEGVRFQQSFVFRYSPRPQTQAAQWLDDVPDAGKRERQQRLLAAQGRVDTERRRSLVGSTVEVLCDGENRSRAEGRRYVGRTRRNDIVVFSAPAAAPGDLCDVLVEDSTARTLFGARR